MAVFLEPGSAEAGGPSGNNSERQARAAGAGTPLSVFVEPLPDGAVRVDSFTPTAHKGSSDSGAVAALAFLQAHQGLPDALDVQSAGGESVSAQLCGGEWLLLQGDVSVTPLEGDRALSPAGLGGARAWVTSAGRANLAVQMDSLAALEAFMPDPARIEALNAATGTTGLIVFTPGGPEGADRRADVSFRAFGPLRGFPEDAASSNMFACLVGVLCAAELLSPDVNVLGGGEAPKHALEDGICGLVGELGGSINAEHGVGLAKVRHLDRTRSDEEIALMRSLKATLDPAGVLGRGRVLP